MDVHEILATVNFYVDQLLFSFDSSILPELIYLTKNEGKKKSLVPKLQLNTQLHLRTLNSTYFELFFCFLCEFDLYLAFMYFMFCSCGTIVDLVDIDLSCDEL